MKRNSNHAISTTNLTTSDLVEFFGAACAARGLRYQQEQRVLELSMTHSGRVISGEVIGRDLYKAEIILNSQRTKPQSSDCSCPMGGYCKHCAAILYELIEREEVQASERNEVAAPLSNNATELSNDVAFWLRLLDHTCERSLGARQHESRSREAQETAIVYLLESAYDGPKLRLKFGKARKNKSGAWGKPARIEVSSILSGRFQSAEDYEIARLWQYSQEGMTSLSRGCFPDSIEISTLLLQLLIRTGRCYWSSNSGQPLCSGPAKNALFEWSSNPDGAQRLYLRTDLADDIPVFAGQMWYVNPQSCRFGGLSLNADVSPLVAEALLRAPSVEPHEIEQVKQRLLELSPSLPRPENNLHFEIHIGTPQPCLSLYVWQNPSYANSSQEEARQTRAQLSFKYDEFTPVADQLEYRKIAGGVISVTRRDLAAEKGFLNELESLGLRISSDESSYGLPTSVCLTTQNDDFWYDFRDKVVPELREKGWQVDCDKSFKYEVVTAEESWDADATEGKDFWFSLRIDITVEEKRYPLLPIILAALRRLPDTDPLSQFDKLNRDGFFYAPMSDGRRVRLPFERVRLIVEVLLGLFQRYLNVPLAEVPRGLPVALPHLMKLSERIDLSDTKKAGGWRIGQKLESTIRKVRAFAGLAKVLPPPNFQAVLRPYQLDGLYWLDFIRNFELGGILADDMGLGKTVQTLAHISVEKYAGRLKAPYLVVCPTSVLPNWLSEAENFSPELKVTALYGSERSSLIESIPESDIVLTTYALVARDFGTLKSHKWTALILDEAQMVKNSTTQVSQALCKLKAQYRLCLTGTPVENHLGELWSQFNFLLPGFLNDLSTFNRDYRNPIERQSDQSRRRALAARTRPFILRRTKELVAKELPAKNIIINKFELLGAQRDLYETVRVSMYEKIRESLVAKGLARSQIVVLDALLKLRQVCCDPRLLSIPAAKNVTSSSKLELLMQMLEELIQENRRILLFSQFTSMLDLIVPELKSRQIEFVELRGDTKERSMPVKRFQSKEVPLFLLSLKAGGFGLNLTAADTVIHYDPWWNPAVENQATDRAHRIGQNKSVFVFKLIANNTIEEKMLQLQERKQLLADSIFTEDNSLPSKLTVEDLEFLFE